MDFKIRKMEKKDIPQVQHVAKTSWNATYEGIIPRNIQDSFLSNAYNDQSMERRLDGSHIFVAETDGEIVGFANYSPVSEDGKAELGALYLRPEYQGKGAGTAFLEEGKEKLDDVKEIFINVEKDNEIGKNFYKAKGFEVVSEFYDNFGGYILKTLRMVLKVKE